MPKGTWTLRFEDVLLPGPNQLMRMHAQRYRQLRDELRMIGRASLTPKAPSAPLERCRIEVEMWRPTRSLLDVDAKFGAIKPLLDVLQPDRAYARKVGTRSLQDVTPGLALIRDDRDGEGDLAGCIKSLSVQQHVGDAHVEVVVTALP